MAKEATIQFYRGDAADAPTLAEGEPGWCIDTEKLLVGTGAGNVVINDVEPSPLDTKGDIWVYDGSIDTRLGVGTNGQVLSADSGQDTGLIWITPFASPLTTKGDLWSHDGIEDTRQGVGTNGQILSADSGETNGLKWIDPPGMTSPLTTLGDLWTHDGIEDVRLPVGTDGQILYADSGEPTGLRWDDPPSGGSGESGFVNHFLLMGG